MYTTSSKYRIYLKALCHVYRNAQRILNIHTLLSLTALSKSTLCHRFHWQWTSL